jgi:prepilin-type N-terminal cleavage/methylation domain-containing protein
MIVRRGFTLVELLITVSIIGIMASMVLFAMFQSQEAAREQKTRALIAKLSNVIMQRYESYRTRRVPVTFAANATPLQKAKLRLDGLRDLMRMEMPDRWTDVVDTHAFVTSRPSLSQAYLRKFNAVYTGVWPPTEPGLLENQGAECLYMIVMESLAQEGDAREVFKAGDTGDTDGDGFPEFLDAWRNPIRFLRWAPGLLDQSTVLVRGKVVTYTKGSATGMGMNQVVTSPKITAVAIAGTTPTGLFSKQGADYGSLILTKAPLRFYSARITGYTWGPGSVTFSLDYAPPDPGPEKQPFKDTQLQPGDEFVIMGADPFDSRRVYDKVSWPYPDGNNVSPFALVPLVYSAGRDKCFGIRSEIEPAPFSYKTHGVNPYFAANDPNGGGGTMIGAQDNFPNELNYSPNGWLDNITSHDLSRR